MKRLTLLYLTGYLAVGGIVLLFAPDMTLSLLLSNGEYGDVMPRVAGMFMLVLSGLIASFVRREDYSYYLSTILARSFIVVTLTVLYFRTHDPLFLVLNAIVLLGLVREPSMGRTAFLKHTNKSGQRRERSTTRRFTRMLIP